MTFGSLGATSMSSTLPPMLAGPMDRKRNDERIAFGDRLIIAVSRAGVCATSAGDRNAMSVNRAAGRVMIRASIAAENREGRRTTLARGTSELTTSLALWR